MTDAPTSDFAHVADARIRSLLVLGCGDAPTISHALRATGEALDSDVVDENVPFGVVDARTEALGEAEAAWASDDGEGTVAALRRCWSVRSPSPATGRRTSTAD